MAPSESEVQVPDSADVIIFPPLLLAASAVLGVGLWWLVPAPKLPSAVAITGAILLGTGGIVIDRWAQRSLRAADTAVHPSHSTETIASTGAFAFSRNPIYVAQGMLFAAMGFAIRSPSFFAALVPWFLAIRIGVVAREEQYLQKKFGNAYAAYKARVRRWI